ncbi:hypothetical protein [Pseudonocardia sp. WMMC193]|uniref:hypothetical protein n=1 Tax=Pseudonocardia sp. WMMC193 TaxID=2911965 RepID=UPI001F41223C|nr:hypothetical protein [Pseudonocardia sp. WMMC193]MCF7552032.1 hypothetical protein [Pseudonocardia sp. WMMC193]
MTLLDFLLALLGDSPEDLALQQDFADNPVATLQALDLGDLTAEDVHDALVLVQDNQTVEFGDTDYNTGGNTIVGGPVPAFAHHEAAPEGHSAIEYIQTYVTHTEVQDGDTVLGSPVQQVIDAGDDVNQVITTTTTAASGAGAVAAQGDIEDSQVVTGSGNVFGSGNVIGDDNTTAFGDGDATSADVHGVSVSGGGAFSVTGPATGDYDVTDSGNTTTVTDTTTTEISDSGNTDVDSSYSYTQDDHSETNTNVGNEVHDGSHNTSDLEINV